MYCDEELTEPVTCPFHPKEPCATSCPALIPPFEKEDFKSDGYACFLNNSEILIE